jgi:hypothetical protein
MLKQKAGQQRSANVCRAKCTILQNGSKNVIGATVAPTQFRQPTRIKMELV